MSLAHIRALRSSQVPKLFILKYTAGRYDFSQRLLRGSARCMSGASRDDPKTGEAAVLPDIEVCPSHLPMLRWAMCG